MPLMQSRTLVIVGLISIFAGLLLVGGWIVSAALNLADSALELSVFEPHAGGCAWYRQGTSGEEKEITKFAVDCAKVQASWNLAGDSAVVWFPDDELASQDELLYLVDVRNRKTRRLVAADPGEPQLYAIGEDDRILAFTENQQINVVAGQAAEGAESAAATPPPSEIEYLGKRYPSSTFPDGQDVLVHALDLSSGSWQVAETKASRCCAEGAPGVSALNSYLAYLKDGRLAERHSARLLGAEATYVSIPETSSIVQKVRDKLKLSVDAGEAPWFSLKPSGWKKGLVFRGTRSGARHATGVAVFSEGEALQRIPGFTYKPNDVLQLMIRGRYLLVTEWGSGMQPHLYDMQSGQLLYSSTVATGVTFWPEPWKESQKGVK